MGHGHSFIYIPMIIGAGGGAASRCSPGRSCARSVRRLIPFALFRQRKLRDDELGVLHAVHGCWAFPALIKSIRSPPSAFTRSRRA